MESEIERFDSEWRLPNVTKEAMSELAVQAPGYAYQLLKDMGYTDTQISKKFKVTSCTSKNELKHSLAGKLMSLDPNARKKVLAEARARQHYLALNLIYRNMDAGADPFKCMAELRKEENDFRIYLQSLGELPEESQKVEVTQTHHVYERQVHLIDQWRRGEIKKLVDDDDIPVLPPLTGIDDDDFDAEVEDGQEDNGSSESE